MAGDPRCQYCHGKGGTRGARGWIKCPFCFPKMTRAQQDIQRRLNGFGAKYPDGDGLLRENDAKLPARGDKVD